MSNENRCRMCDARLKHPVKRGRRAQFCGTKCRSKHYKEWRRKYDAQEYVKAAKREREMKKYHREKTERERSPAKYRS